MNQNAHLLWRVLRGGLLLCAGPLAFDLCASLYAGRIGVYAPFLYPMFFALGVLFVIDDMRRKRKEGKRPANTP